MTTPEATEQVSRSGSGKAISIVAILISVVAVGASVYLHTQFMMISKTLALQSTQLQHSRDTSMQQLSGDLSDVQPLFLQLNNISQHIQQLTVVPTQPAVSSMKNLFVIRHVEKTNTPVVDQPVELAVKQNILMQVNIAQWSLLHHNQTIFQSAIQNVSTLLQQYFALSKATPAIVNQLKTLQSATIAAPTSQSVNVNPQPAAPATEPAPAPEKKINPPAEAATSVET
ncbi:MAG: hypothetical protein A3C44_02220 [Gammaproteobacteria bacterium RIFCSPHIGHO2_02_FULL_39_13]|nr:MAG: hypothetical protein A3C44_02220 [Gammaproteobacteria bacterium RIFCSPHIGHO2_02_FULL_39_13]OGT48351.1 MAG: hypothetical protein A3E53_05915 [Gammaproteobacteria bacterium RIFCSPHIGHO2_12_FULL_39_24]